MDSKRLIRVGSLLRDELTNVILRGTKDPRIDTLVSITELEVSRDLSLAKVYVSYYGSKEKREEIIRALNHAAGFFQREVAARVRLRFTPHFVFVYDESIERGFRVTETLKKLNNS